MSSTSACLGAENFLFLEKYLIQAAHVKQTMTAVYSCAASPALLKALCKCLVAKDTNCCTYLCQRGYLISFIFFLFVSRITAKMIYLKKEICVYDHFTRGKRDACFFFFLQPSWSYVFSDSWNSSNLFKPFKKLLLKFAHSKHSFLIVSSPSTSILSLFFSLFCYSRAASVPNKLWGFLSGVSST